MSEDMLNTKIYTTHFTEAKSFAMLCGVDNVVTVDAGIIGYGFDQRRNEANCVIGFQKGSGFDDGEFNGVKFTEISRQELRDRLLNFNRIKK